MASADRGLKLERKPLPESNESRELKSELCDDVQATEGAEALGDVTAFVRRFINLTDAQARVTALFVAHCHCFDAADCTPYLSINSAEKQSGKTRLLEVLKLLVPKPWYTGRVSAAVLVRKIDALQPTLLLDESDAAFSGEKEYAEALRGTLNNGYRRGGTHSLCVGKGAEISFADLSVFCPKAIAGIGKLPDTVADRSIPIRLKRAQRGTVERFRERDAKPEADGVISRFELWCIRNIDALRKARPDFLPQLSDRQFDTAEPLLAIADLAGGEWPQAARRAIVELCTQAQIDDDSSRVRALFDIRQVLKADEMPSQYLCDDLAKIEGSPWGEWSKGKAITPIKLVKLLKPLEIYPGQIQNGNARGYKRCDFQDAFSRYLPSIPPTQSVKTSETHYSCGSDTLSKVSGEQPYDTSEKSVSLNNHAGFRHFDTLKADIQGITGEKGAFPDSDEVTI